MGSSKTLGFLIVLMVVMIASAVVSISTVAPAARIYEDKAVLSGDILYTYQTYVIPAPDVDNLSPYGNANAPLMAVVYLDPESDTSRQFVEEVLPRLDQDYIESGKLKLYFKHHITSEELKGEGNKYKYIKALYCVEQLAEDSYFDFYFELIQTGGKAELQELAEEHGILVEAFEECLENQDNNKIMEQMKEVERLGMTYLSPRIYVGLSPRDSTIINGIPRYERLKQKIRNYQIQFGD